MRREAGWEPFKAQHCSLRCGHGGSIAVDAVLALICVSFVSCLADSFVGLMLARREMADSLHRINVNTDHSTESTNGTGGASGPCTLWRGDEQHTGGGTAA